MNEQQMISKILCAWCFLACFIVSVCAGERVYTNTSQTPKPVPTSEEAPRFYSSVSVRPVFSEDATLRWTGSGSVPDVKMDFEPGIGGGISAGYMFNNILPYWLQGLHVELEGNFMYRAVSHFRNTATNASIGSGDLLQFSPMANVIYDWRNSSPITPYFGLGGGFAATYLVAPGTSNAGWAFPPEFQALLGAKTVISKDVDFLFGYRYVLTFSDTFNGNLDQWQISDMSNHILEAGVVVKF